MRCTAYIFLIVTLLLAGPLAFGQTYNEFDSGPRGTYSGAIADKLILVISPETPMPESLATVEIRTIAFNLGNVNITWLEDGKLSESGIGKTKHTFLTGKAGSETVITVIVRTTDSVVYEKQIIVSPASVDLVWESSSTVPPFYKGKALYPLLGALTIIAVPEVLDPFDGSIVPAEQLFYKWKKNNEVLGKLSGSGRRTLSLATPELRMPFKISVEVSKANGIPVAGHTITIDASQPEILLYEKSPLYGTLFNRDVGNKTALGSKEITFDVFPLFFNSTDRNRLSYKWTTNYETIEDFRGPFITLRSTGTGSGTASVNVEVSNQNFFNEIITRNVKVEFGGQ